MKFDTKDRIDPIEMTDLLIRLGKDQGYKNWEEWDQVLHSFCSSLEYNWEEEDPISNEDATLVIEFEKPIFKELFLKQFDPRKNLNDGFYKEVFGHTFKVAHFSDVDGKILWDGKYDPRAKSI